MNPNVAKLFGIVAEAPHFALVMELYEGGTLEALLADPNVPLTWLQRVTLGQGVASGLEYLHTRPRPTIHGDLKSVNVLLTSRSGDAIVKICDFGLSLTKSSTTGSTMAGAAPGSAAMYGTLLWMAPEQMKGAVRANKASDVYSFGLLLLELATRRPPWQNALPSVVPMLVLSGQRPDVPADVPAGLASLIRDCWAAEPGARPTMTGALHRLDVILQVMEAEAEQGEDEMATFYAPAAPPAALTDDGDHQHHGGGHHAWGVA